MSCPEYDNLPEYEKQEIHEYLCSVYEHYGLCTEE
jgi:hypothetical protein